MLILKSKTSDSHISDYKNWCLPWCDAVLSGTMVPTFQRNMLPPALG